MKTSIQSIATGISQQYNIKENTFSSAYKKDNYKNSCEISYLGLKSDIQVDKRFHGGIDKAIHIGSTKHFESFYKLHNKELNKLAIGCNIFVDNQTEDNVCIGDVYTIGEVEIEVTQPRQPCWKIGALFSKEISRFIIKESATGWYVRVLKEGNITDNCEVILKKRVSNITIKELSTYLKNPPLENKELINNILNHPALALSYKDDFQKLLTNG
jgi:MOSC domain-containing protein YiiM